MRTSQPAIPICEAAGHTGAQELAPERAPRRPASPLREQEATQRTPTATRQQVSSEVAGTTEHELRELSGQVVAEPELASQAVMLAELRYGDDRDGTPEQATPPLYVVQGACARAIGMEFDREVVCDQLDVVAFVHGGQVRKDGRQSPDRPAAPAARPPLRDTTS